MVSTLKDRSWSRSYYIRYRYGCVISTLTACAKGTKKKRKKISSIIAVGHAINFQYLYTSIFSWTCIRQLLMEAFWTTVIANILAPNKQLYQMLITLRIMVIAIPYELTQCRISGLTILHLLRAAWRMADWGYTKSVTAECGAISEHLGKTYWRGALTVLQPTPQFEGCPQDSATVWISQKRN